MGSFIGALAGMATGGKVRGPGTSTCDSVPLLASSGEFIVNAAAARQPGVEQLLTGLNTGGVRPVATSGIPHYAAGGAVTGGALAPQFRVVNVLDPSTLGDHLATAAGEQAVLNVIARNPSKIRNSLT